MSPYEPGLKLSSKNSNLHMPIRNHFDCRSVPILGIFDALSWAEFPVQGGLQSVVEWNQLFTDAGGADLHRSMTGFEALPGS